MKRFVIVCCGWLLIALYLHAATVSQSPFGINVHLAENETLSRVVEAGIHWLRIDINWRNCEPNKGDYRFADVDRVINFARNHNLSVLAVMAYTPDWANNGKGANHPADDLENWRVFVRVTVNRYREHIKYWSIWNEPNVPDFFALGKDVFMARVWQPAVQEIRKWDSGAFVVGPDLAHLTTPGQEWFLWLKYILNNAAGEIDVVSHHLYDSRGAKYVFELLESGEPLIPSVQNLIEDCGFADRPLWMTETGWNTLTLSEEMQAAHYLETLQLRRSRQYPDKMFFYEIRDDVNPEVSSWGILRSDGSAKPAFQVYRDFISGNYPSTDIDPIPEEEARDCYAERLIPTTAQSGRLTPLRRLRSDILSRIPGGKFWVEAYSRWSRDLSGISVRDSRLFHSGVQLMTRSADWLIQHADDFWTSPLPEPLRAAACRWLDLALEQPLPIDLRRLLLNAKQLMRYLPKGVTPRGVSMRPRFIYP